VNQEYKPKHIQVIEAFLEYIKNGDKSLIEDFTKEDIEFALIKENILADGHDRPLYQAMTRRIEELKQLEAQKRTAKERWKDRIIGALFALSVGIILWVLKNFFTTPTH